MDNNKTCGLDIQGHEGKPLRTDSVADLNGESLKTWNKEESSLSMNKPKLPTYEACEAERAQAAFLKKYQDEASTRRTLNYEDSWSNQKDASPQATAASYQPSANNAQVLTSGCFSPQIIGVPNSISSVTPTGLNDSDSYMRLERKFPKSGSQGELGLPVLDKDRKALPIWTYQMEYFPDAFLAEVGVAVAGNLQHNPGQPLHWAREKSIDQMNTAFRHMWDHGRGNVKDTDGQYHLAKAIWRLKAELQLTIERERDAKR